LAPQRQSAGAPALPGPGWLTLRAAWCRPAPRTRAGEGEAQLRDTFKRARMAAPAIIFLDEIDAVAVNRWECDPGPGVAGLVWARTRRPTSPSDAMRMRLCGWRAPVLRHALLSQLWLRCAACRAQASGGDGAHGGGDAGTRLLSTLLTEMDGMELATGVLVLAATNR
jgi:SpoVK/Ycf46/Vps4 family AAA+-type ATPase